MSVGTSVNYSASGEQFTYPQVGSDQFNWANMIEALAKALENHDHSSTHGLSAQRLNASQAAGDMFYATAAGVIARLAKGTAGDKLQMNSGATAPAWAATTYSTQDVTTSETTTSTSFTDLTTSGPAVTLTPGATRDHDLAYCAQAVNSGANQTSINVAIAGASAASANTCSHYETVGSTSLYRRVIAASAASGATHTMKYAVGAGTGTFVFRRIIGVVL